MSDAEIVVGVRGDISGGRVVKANLDEISNSGDKATSSMERMRKAVNDLTNSTNPLVNAMKGLAVYMGARELIRMSDEYTNLSARIKNATRSTQEYTDALKGLKTVSNQTGSALSDAVDVFQRLSFVRNEIGATITDMVTFTGTVQKLGVISGASTEGMKAGLLQLGQAMSAGIVRAEEFNSVVENMPSVAKAIGDQFGVTTGQLRQLVLAGVVDSQDVFTAILNASKEVEEQYAQMPMTIGRAFSQLQNELQNFVGATSQASGATSAIIGVIDMAKLSVYGLGQMFEGVSNVIASIGVGILKTITDLVNGVINTVNYGINYANKLPGVNIQTVGNVDPFGLRGVSFDSLNDGYQGLQTKYLNKDAPDTILDKTLGNDAQSSASKEIKALSKDYEDLAKKVSGKNKQSAEEKKIQRELEQAYKDSRTETQKLYDYIKEQEALTPFAKTAAQANAIKINIANARKEIAELAAEAELNSPIGKAFKSLAGEIDDGFKDAFKSAFTESDGGFKKLLSGWKNTFKDFLADLAYQALARPIMVSIVGAVGGMMGLSGSAVGSVLGTGTSSTGTRGSGIGIGNLSSLSGLLNGGLYSQTLGSVGMGLGNLIAGNGYNFVGPSMAGSIGAGAFGNLGYGAIGGIAANLFGLGNKNQYVNMATGTLGALAGGAIGTSMGTILGMAGGPIGAIAGSFLGTALGGLFGGAKPSDKSRMGSIDLSTLVSSTSGMTGKKFSQENENFVNSILTEVKSLTSMLASVGGTTSGNLNFVVGNRDGLRLDGYNGQNFGNNADAFVDAIMARVVSQTTGITGTFKTILDKLGVGDLTKLQEGFTFGQSYDALVNPKSTSEQLADAIKALDDNMQSLIQTAIDLGLPTEEYTIALQKQKDASVAALKAQQAGFDSLEQATATFKSFLDGQALGSSSSMSPLEKLGLAQSNFDDLLKKAQGGDLSVSSQLLSSGQTLIDVARSTYSSSTDFTLIEKLVRDSISNIAHQVGIPGYAVGTDGAASGWAKVGERGQEIVNFNGGEQVFTAGQTAGIMAVSGNVATDVVRTNAQVVGIQSESLEEMRLMRKEMKELRRQYERMANNLAVNK